MKIDDENIVEDCQETENENFIAVKPLWNPKHYMRMCLFFSYIPVAIMYFMNIKRMKEYKLRRKAILITISATIFLSLVYNIVESYILYAIILFIVDFLIAYYFKYSQLHLYKRHVEGGAKTANILIPIIISISYQIILIAIIISPFLQEPDTISPKATETADTMHIYKRYNDHIYYWSPVIREDVVLVADYYEDIGLFIDDDNSYGLGLKLIDGEHILIYRNASVDQIEDSKVQYLEELKLVLNNDLKLSSSAIGIHICNDNMEILKVID